MKPFSAIAAIQMFAACAAFGGLDIPVEEPLEVMQSNATAGDRSAQFNLGLFYQEGRNLPKNPGLAMEWYRKAALAGSVEAQFNLGVLLLNGVEVKRDEKEGARWINAAALNGMFEAQKTMIKLYTAGKGVEKNPASALTWDFMARRTLELRYGGAAGAPPKPGAVRADGAAEVVGNDGKKQWIHPDGSRETADAAGIRHIEHKNGSKTTVQTDGGWETIFPNGLSERVTPQGRKILSDASGHSETTETDGSRIVEGDGTDSGGDKVRIVDAFSPDGKKVSHRVIHGNSTYEEKADGTKVVETTVAKDDDGEALILTEPVGSDGAIGKGKLRRVSDGVSPKKFEIWIIRRVIHVGEGKSLAVIEKYSNEGLFTREEDTSAPAARVASARPSQPATAPSRPAPNSVPMSPINDPASRPRLIPMEMPTRVETSMVMPNATNYDDPTAFAPKVDIAPKLAELAQIERDARNFGGATDAVYQRAQAAAASYLIPLPVIPQKATSVPAWLREKAISQTTLHESALVPILDDRSKVVPFGPHGAELIKASSWKHAETEHFIVHYREEAQARLTVQYIEGAFTVLTQLMNLDTARAPAKNHVFVFPEAEWKDYLEKNGHLPLLAGFAYKTELLLGAATDRADRAQSIKVLCHEVTHALVARFYGGVKPPIWMNEGLAEYIALRTLRSKGVNVASTAREEKGSGNPPKTREAAMARMAGTPDPVMDVDRLFTRIRYGNQTTPDRLVAFYANSQKCLQVLFEKLPLEGFPKFFKTLVAGNNPDVSLATAYGKQCDSVASFGRIVNSP